jgi:hypothetical protein
MLPEPTTYRGVATLRSETTISKKAKPKPTLDPAAAQASVFPSSSLLLSRLALSDAKVYEPEPFSEPLHIFAKWLFLDQCLSAAERTGNRLKGSKGFYLKAKARIWP